MRRNSFKEISKLNQIAVGFDFTYHEAQILEGLFRTKLIIENYKKMLMEIEAEAIEEQELEQGGGVDQKENKVRDRGRVDEAYR